MFAMAEINDDIESIPGEGAQAESDPGTSRGEQGQVQGEQEEPPRSLLPQGPPKPPSRTPRLASIEEPTIKAYVTEIKN